MKNYRLFAALALAALLPTVGFAAPSEAELMKQAKFSKAEAEKLALEKVPQGKIEAAELEEEHSLLIWSFDIAQAGSKNITEVQVDAKTGKIVSVNVETPADQAKEKAADKAKDTH